MKECPWCGKQFPDDATACPFDQHPLVPLQRTPPAPTPQPASAAPPGVSSTSGAVSRRREFGTTDRTLSIILVVVFVPLSLWGGSESWAGDADVLPFLMLLVGAGFVIFEGIRLASPLIGALLGALVPVLTLLPSFLLYEPRRDDVTALMVSIVVGLALGLFVSTIAWFFKRQRPSLPLAAVAIAPVANPAPASLSAPPGAPCGDATAEPAVEQPPAPPPLAQSEIPANPLCGVHGWLKFFVVVNLYVAPILFALRYIMAWIGFALIAEDYPGIILVGLIETVVGGFLIWKWIQIARCLRDIRPGAVQEAKTWLKISLGWILLDAPLTFLSGMSAEALLPGVLKGIVTGLIGFAIWYSYFNVSKRVQATYPDWDK